MPTTPFTEAGQVIEPLVSVPIETGTKPCAIAAALPELEPQGLYFKLNGLLVWPLILVQPLVEGLPRKFAHSERFALPRIMNPDSLSFLTNGASFLCRLFLNAKEPAVLAMPIESMLSFKRIGTP